MAPAKKRASSVPASSHGATMLREARVEVLAAAQAVSKVANIEADFAATIGAADYMNNLEATFNLGVLFPLIGDLVAAIYARIVYIKDDPSHFQMPSPDVHSMHWFTIRHDLENRARLITEVREPFASFSNLGFFVTGGGFFLLQFFSGAPLPEQTYGLAIFLVLLGACSGAFHSDGSRLHTWQHHSDRFAMYTVFSYMACIMLNGLYHAMRGAPAGPRSCCSVVTNCAGCFVAAFFLVRQEVRRRSAGVAQA